jgi:hypothetical protein
LALRLKIKLTSRRSVGSVGAIALAPRISARSLPLSVTLPMAYSLA